MFVNMLTSMLFWSVRSCSSLFKWYYLKNTIFFLRSWFHLWSLHQILNILNKMKVAIANVFLNIQTVKYLVGPLSKKRRFRTSFDSHHVKGSQTLAKSVWNLFSSLWGRMICKIPPLLKFEIIGLFVNTLTADCKSSIADCQSLSFPIQMQLSEKQKNFPTFFVPFMESTWNFKRFLKKQGRHSYWISEITECQKFGWTTL